MATEEEHHPGKRKIIQEDERYAPSQKEALTVGV